MSTVISTTVPLRQLGGCIKNASQVAANVASTTYTNTGLVASTKYGYYVAALDAAGNESTKTNAEANATSATTLSPPDTTRPTDPVRQLPLQSMLSKSVCLGPRALDNVSVAGYNVYRAVVTNGVVGTYTKLPPSVSGDPYTLRAPGNTTPVTYSDGLVNPSTTYSYQVEAVDSSGNLSLHRVPQDNSTRATTPSLGDTTPPSQPHNVRSFTTQTGPALTPTANTITVTWDPSTDNVGVSRYELYRKAPD
ncbi:MAG: hypothetical protein WDN27_03760 [Candidatus Saccharibacteria bacterium]